MEVRQGLQHLLQDEGEAPLLQAAVMDLGGSPGVGALRGRQHLQTKAGQYCNWRVGHPTKAGHGGMCASVLIRAPAHGHSLTQARAGGSCGAVFLF